ncbi:putative DNA-binding pseudobarrel domain superfamily [Helianthus anomalus]
MIYGFLCYLGDTKRKSLFKYLIGNTNIRTTSGNVFKVKIYPLSNSRYYLYNGWYQLVNSLKIPSDSWLIFHYEEALESFRILYFLSRHFLLLLVIIFTTKCVVTKIIWYVTSNNIHYVILFGDTVV